MNTLLENRRQATGLSTANPGISSTPENTVSNDLFVKMVTDNYSRYITKCYGYLKCAKLAEDAVQEGILVAHESLDSLKDTKVLGAWLHQIVVRKAIDLLRKNRKFLSFDTDIEELASYNKQGVLNDPFWSEVANPEEEILKNEGLEQVKISIESLNDMHRIPLLLKDYEGFSVKEISEILQISESNVKVRIHRGRIKLKNALSGYFFPASAKDSE